VEATGKDVALIASYLELIQAINNMAKKNLIQNKTLQRTAS